MSEEKEVVPLQLKHCWCGHELPVQYRHDYYDCPKCGRKYYIY